MDHVFWLGGCTQRTIEYMVTIGVRFSEKFRVDFLKTLDVKTGTQI